MSLRMTARPAKGGFCSSVTSGALTGAESCAGAISTLFSRILLLRSSGVRPRLFRISALFIQNSSMISVFLDGVSSAEESIDFDGSGERLSVLAKGVEVTAGAG